MIQIKFYEAGFCTHPDYIVTSKLSFRIRKFPMICTLMHHPKHGYILFDVGYNQNFFKATNSFPNYIYRCITPVTIEKTLKELLIADGINPEEIRHVILSHFHADHISAIDDFPNAQIFCSKAGYEHASNVGFFGVTKAILPMLMQNIIGRKLTFFEDLSSYMQVMGGQIEGVDLWGDGSMIACGLTGHAVGHYGLFCSDTQLGDTFLIGDAVWTQETLQGLHNPHWITHLLSDNRRSYIDTMELLRELTQQFPKVNMVPSHCCNALNTM